MDRFWFVTADWETVLPRDGGAVHGGDCEGELDDGDYTTADLRAQLPSGGWFGGVVFVRA